MNGRIRKIGLPRSGCNVIAFWFPLKLVATQRRVHPLRKYLESLKWEGIPRLDRWLSTYLGVEASNYS